MSSSTAQTQSPPQNCKVPLLKTFWQLFCPGERVLTSSHQVQCNIPTFEALLRKNNQPTVLVSRKMQKV